MTYLPYSLSLMTRLEKSESPERRMKVPISGRVKTSSRASIASRMSVAPVGVRALHRDLPLDDVGREQVAELRLQVGADAHRDVVEVDEQRGVRRVEAGVPRRGERARRHRLRAAVHGGDGAARDAGPLVA